MDFTNIENGIREAEYILGYEENWDENGALKPHESSLKKAILFIKEMGKKHNSDFDHFEINPCPNGSIDISFFRKEKEDVSLLLNFDKERGFNFFGRDWNTGFEIKSKEPKRINDRLKVS
ncbi:MAG: hypothetical protein ACI88L_000661, partial [Candidatus Paceibacteria bacterium]